MRAEINSSGVNCRDSVYFRYAAVSRKISRNTALERPLKLVFIPKIINFAAL